MRSTGGEYYVKRLASAHCALFTTMLRAWCYKEDLRTYDLKIVDSFLNHSTEKPRLSSAYVIKEI